MTEFQISEGQTALFIDIQKNHLMEFMYSGIVNLWYTKSEDIYQQPGIGKVPRSEKKSCRTSVTSISNQIVTYSVTTIHKTSEVTSVVEQ